MFLQVSSLLGEHGTPAAPSSPHRPGLELEHTVPMEPLPLHGIAEQTQHHYQPGVGGVCMANMGYEELHQVHSPQDDYEFAPSPGHVSTISIYTISGNKLIKM